MVFGSKIVIFGSKMVVHGAPWAPWGPIQARFRPGGAAFGKHLPRNPTFGISKLGFDQGALPSANISPEIRLLGSGGIWGDPGDPDEEEEEEEDEN